MAEDCFAGLHFEGMLSDRFASNLHQIVASCLGPNTSSISILTDVKKSFGSFKLKAIAYIQASAEAASFVCKTTVIEDVKSDVKNNQSTEKLLEFTKDMIRHLKMCESCLFEFEKVETVLKTHLGNAIMQAEEKLRTHAVTETCSKTEPKQSGLDLAGKAVLGVGAMALGTLAILTGGGVFLAVAAVVASSAAPVTLSGVIGTVVGVTVSVTVPASHVAMAGAGVAALGAGAVLKGGNAVVEGVVAGVGTVASGVWSALFSAEIIGEEQLRLLEEAKRQVVQISEDRCRAIIEIKKIQTNLEIVKSYIEGEGHIFIKGLREEAQNPCYKERNNGLLVLRKYHKIVTSLNGLKECMEQVLMLTTKYAV